MTPPPAALAAFDPSGVFPLSRRVDGSMTAVV